MKGLCEYKIALSEDDIGSDVIKCHRDAEGAYELVSNGEVLAVTALCEKHREHIEEAGWYDELQPTDDYTPRSVEEGETA